MLARLPLVAILALVASDSCVGSHVRRDRRLVRTGRPGRPPEPVLGLRRYRARAARLAGPDHERRHARLRAGRRGPDEARGPDPRLCAQPPKRAGSGRRRRPRPSPERPLPVPRKVRWFLPDPSDEHSSRAI